MYTTLHLIVIAAYVHWKQTLYLFTSKTFVLNSVIVLLVLIHVFMFDHLHLLFLLKINIDNYGIDWDGPVPGEVGEGNHVEVPETISPLNQEHLQGLQESIDPLRDSLYHGVDCYVDVLQFITQRLQET
jgi:hypothetical protein